MIKIENVDTYGWKTAIRGMRNPLNSWDKSDSHYTVVSDLPEGLSKETVGKFLATNPYTIGEADLKLMKSLSKAGSDHGKFLRMINVSLDITAPLYWWKEFDTYKVGTVANSCSTMHKIHAKEFELDDFSHEHLLIDEYFENSMTCLEYVIGVLNYYRNKYIETKDKKYWWQMIQLLPSSYNQKRTVQINYQVLKTMYYARRNHKLDEWRAFCAWCETLPYFKDICLQE